jgi:deaminated glutathione amidase
MTSRHRAPRAALAYAAGMRIALCQLAGSPDPAVNLARVTGAMSEAARQGASLAVFPEATQARFGSDLRAIAEPLDGAFGTGLAGAARATGVALVAGVFEPAPDGRVYNTAAAYDGTGTLVAAYRKLHLFDALGQQESAVVAPGSEPVVVDLAGMRVGLMTCYDLRFPELARTLATRGAELIVVPAAWAAGPLKEDQWVTLVRARAIENTVWVAAAGQVPDPSAPPVSAPTGIGRSMLVDPEGTVRASLGPTADLSVTELDSTVTGRVRAAMPCLRHRRDDVLAAGSAHRETA